MTTPRIEEMIKSIKPNIRFREDIGVLAKRECEEVISQLWEIQEKKLRQALTEAHQAGIDEAVGKMEDLFVEKAKYNEDFVDNGYGEPINTSYWTIYEGDWEKIIKALQDNK